MTVRPETAEPPAQIAPVVKEVTVALSPEGAFALFASRIGEWWPLATHSVEGERAQGCAFEERVGGRLYEFTADGVEHTWGTVISWDPPRGLAVSWHPGRSPDSEQHLEITFTGGERGTTIRLVHTGWERLGAEGRSERDSYDSGWDYVLGFFTRRA
jgi:hypothetical protein